MKRLIYILAISVCLVAGVLIGAGLVGAGYVAGRIHENTAVFYDTQEFRDMIEAKQEFRFGGFYFAPRTKKNVTVWKIVYVGK